jgi:hypothetical protein
MVQGMGDVACCWVLAFLQRWSYDFSFLYAGQGSWSKEMGMGLLALGRCVTCRSLPCVSRSNLYSCES